PVIEINDEVIETADEENNESIIEENNQLLNNNETLSKVINMQLSDPEATDKELDWTELDANSHIDFIEEPLFVKIFEIDY
ncbi:MAG: hypothetical protein K2K73_01410, partial [Ureaplasma sp.]|nr:hypothetical protein [Ureaplasma sp.]